MTKRNSVKPERKKRAGALRENLLFVLALNIVPLCGAAYIAYAWATGKIEFAAFPHSLLLLAITFLVSVAVVAVAAWAVLPAALALRGKAQIWLKRSGKRWRRGGAAVFAAASYFVAGAVCKLLGSVTYLCGWFIFAAGVLAALTALVMAGITAFTGKAE